MASQNSELLVTNTLFIQIEVHTNQVSLDPATQDNSKIDLCDSDILKLEQNLEVGGSLTTKNIQSSSCHRKKQQMSPNEFTYSIKFLIKDFVLDDTKE